mmetsp:Transcript_51419/g.123272  ORF Transcript_51419/g.123272 Transcript_51419/m.123272 type:complete len:278 (-) Transcript_51419:90-923(-)
MIRALDVEPSAWSVEAESNAVSTTCLHVFHAAGEGRWVVLLILGPLNGDDLGPTLLGLNGDESFMPTSPHRLAAVIHEPSHVEEVIPACRWLEHHLTTLSLCRRRFCQCCLWGGRIEVCPSIVVPKQAVSGRRCEERHHCFEVELYEGDGGMLVVDEAVLEGPTSIKALLCGAGPGLPDFVGRMAEVRHRLEAVGSLTEDHLSRGGVRKAAGARSLREGQGQLFGGHGDILIRLSHLMPHLGPSLPSNQRLPSSGFGRVVGPASDSDDVGRAHLDLT